MRIKIDLPALVAAIGKDESGYFEQDAVYKAITDALNAAGIDAELRYFDTDYDLMVAGERAGLYYFSDDPGQAVIQTVRNIADELNASRTQSAWVTYKNGEYCLHIEPRPKEEQEEEQEEEQWEEQEEEEDLAGLARDEGPI